MSKLKVTLTGLMLSLVPLFGSRRVDSRNPGTENNHNGYAQSVICYAGSSPAL